VDSLASPEFRSHYVVLIARKGNDYLMLDPWPYQTDINKETYLMPRYSQGNTLQRSIMQILLYENTRADGRIQMPGVESPADTTSSAPRPSEEPIPTPVSTGPRARVRDDVTFGLNVRTSEDTSSKANIVETVQPGTLLSIVEPGGWTEIGMINHWIRVKTPSGRDGLVAAWYLETVPGEVYPTLDEAPASSTSTAPGPEAPPKKSKLVVKVQKSGLAVYESASGKGKVISREKSGAKLIVVEEAGKATTKIGTAGKWLNVKASNGKRGFLDGGSVKLV
jgi:hypothetical protein